METKKIVASDLLHSYRISADIWRNVIEPNLSDDQKTKASDKITFPINAVNGDTGDVLNLFVGHTRDKQNSLRRTFSNWINFGSTLKVGDYLRFSWEENNLHIHRVSAPEVESAAATTSTSTTNQAITKVKVSSEECRLGPKKMWLQRWYRQQGLKYYSGTGGDKSEMLVQAPMNSVPLPSAVAFDQDQPSSSEMLVQAPMNSVPLPSAVVFDQDQPSSSEMLVQGPMNTALMNSVPLPSAVVVDRDQPSSRITKFC